MFKQTARSPRAPAADFYWGVATSAFQIEGATDVDGRAPSIWDRFADTGHHIEDGTTGAVTCDHYRRWREDVAIMAELGLDAYRFSIAWPRVMPTGVGAVNEAGLDFYDRLVDGLLDAGIEPFVTLYHWDLPAALQDRGGWANRDVAAAFAPYAATVAARLGDRVRYWITHNEPWCAAILGHAEGKHAPGHEDRAEALRVAHHLMLSHGWATRTLRDALPHAKIGLSHMYLHCEPASGSEADRAAATRLDGEFNRWYLDPLYGHGYPSDVVDDYRAQGLLPEGVPDFVHPGDLETIATPTDFLGINYYTRGIARSDRVAEADNAPRVLEEPPAEARTDMGWEVYAAGLQQGLERVHRDYAPIRQFVTENGAAYATAPDDLGRVNDAARIRFLDHHIEATTRARASGVPVDGYFLWSLLDNFEWSYGHAKRFGIVWVDFDSQRRVLKDSARWYRDEIDRRRTAPREDVG